MIKLLAGGLVAVIAGGLAIAGVMAMLMVTAAEDAARLDCPPGTLAPAAGGWSGTVPAGASAGGLGPTQLTHAATIVAVGEGLRVPRQGIVVALATAAQESGFRNYANDGRGGDLQPDQRGCVRVAAASARRGRHRPRLGRAVPAAVPVVGHPGRADGPGHVRGPVLPSAAEGARLAGPAGHRRRPARAALSVPQRVCRARAAGPPAGRHARRHHRHDPGAGVRPGRSGGRGRCRAGSARPTGSSWPGIWCSRCRRGRSPSAPGSGGATTPPARVRTTTPAWTSAAPAGTPVYALADGVVSHRDDLDGELRQPGHPRSLRQRCRPSTRTCRSSKCARGRRSQPANGSGRSGPPAAPPATTCTSRSASPATPSTR